MRHNFNEMYGITKDIRGLRRDQQLQTGEGRGRDIFKRSLIVSVCVCVYLCSNIYI